MQINVNVAQQDIALGCRSSSDNCPIARALARSLREQGWRRVMVMIAPGIGSIRAEGEPRASFPLPRSADSFILAFDMTGSEYVSPFSFSLSIPWTKPEPGIPVPADMQLTKQEATCESK